MNKLIDIKGLERAIENIKSFINKNYITEVIYEELVELINNSKLIPGKQYRIIDYTTTTTQSNTQSAGHQFDIIVTADDVNVLNENARAIQHEGDTYFANSDLSAWKLKYCIDNDTSRFAWVDTTNGKGVIYYMKDEWNNECPYDFKNIQFKHPTDSTTYPDYYYTFSTVISGTVTDHSLLRGCCYSNTIKEYIKSNKQHLNNNVFLNTSTKDSCYNNSFENDCYNNSFGYGCYNNSFLGKCYNNSFKSQCYDNSFGNYCYKNSFYTGCYSNSFANSCFNNTLNDQCYYNSFGNNCNNNSLEQSSHSNSFGNYCYYNSLGRSCTNNSFGNYCYKNLLGNFYVYNSFGNGCNNNSFRVSADTTSNLKNYVLDNHFDDGCSYNVIWNADTTSSSVSLNNINVNRGVIGKRNSYNIINITTLNQNYELQVANNSQGEIKIYCEADLI